MNRLSLFAGRALWLLALICLLPLTGAAFSGKDEAILPAAVGASTVLDTEGHPVKLGDNWQNKPVVLVFIRHFG